jgi:glycosyltransferase involved in cell wall biosynthesis
MPSPTRAQEVTSAPQTIASVAIFIPAFNEEERIGEVIRTVKTLYADSACRGYRLTVIVVDDGSQDRTAQIAAESGADRIIAHGRNMGLGAATRTALTAAFAMGADVAVKLDADFQHDPGDIEKAIQPILKGTADIVYGSRFAGMIHYRMPLVRRLGNKFFTWLMRKLTGWPITDAQTGLMVYGRNYLENFSMPGNYNPPHQTLLDAYHRGLRYAEVPVSFFPRTTGKSFVSLKYPFKVFPQLIRTVMLTAPLKVFVPLGIVSALCGISLGLVELVLYLCGSIDSFTDATIGVLLAFGLQTLFFGLLADLIIQKK